MGMSSIVACVMPMRFIYQKNSATAAEIVYDMVS